MKLISKTKKLDVSYFKLSLVMSFLSLMGAVKGQTNSLLQNISKCDGVLVYFSSDNYINSLYQNVIAEVIKHKFPVYNIHSKREFLDSIINKDKRYIFFDISTDLIGYNMGLMSSFENYPKVYKYTLNVRYGPVFKDSILGKRSILRKQNSDNKYILMNKSMQLKDVFYDELDAFSDQISPVHIAAILNGFIDRNTNIKNYKRDNVFKVYIDTLFFSEIAYSSLNFREESTLRAKWKNRGIVSAYSGYKAVVSKHQMSEVFLRRLKEGKSFFFYDFVIGTYKNNYLIWDAVNGVLYYSHQSMSMPKQRKSQIRKMNRKVRRG